MTNIVYIYDGAAPRYVVIRGPRLGSWLKAQCIPAMWVGLDRGFRLGRERMADLEAAAQESGVRVVLRRGDGR